MSSDTTRKPSLLGRVRLFFTGSFQRKLILFNLTAVFVTTILLFVFLINNFGTITSFSLAQNTVTLEQTVEDYLNKYTSEKATSTWLQIKAALDNLGVLGKTAQKIIDNYDSIRSADSLFKLPLFRTQLHSEKGALTSSASDEVNTLIPPPIAASAAAQEFAKVSSLLNLSIDSVFQANSNNAFVYFVGSKETPITRAYPNINLVDVLGEGLNLLFWKDYFAPNVDAWTNWFKDKDLQKKVPSPVTVEAPYADAAGQGLTLTMFYPLWDSRRQEFAGAVGTDITLAKIIENILSIKVAKTGFAFLMNGKGEIMAMPETGFKLFGVDLKESKQGGLSYYSGSLDSSDNLAIKNMSGEILKNESGIFKLGLPDNKQIVAYASLPALSNNQYQEDRWKIAISVPETEIFETLNATHATITAESNNISLISLVLVLVFLVIVTVVSVLFSNRSTRDIRLLAQAAEQVSAKNYKVDLKMHSPDEIGQLGRVFQNMTKEIRDYTENLESMVAKRTVDLQTANDEITRLNQKLKNENLRLGAELDVARRLQMMVLPSDKEATAVRDLDIAGFMRPADEVGGDYYDILQIEDTVFLGIGDVTGHGLPAGVIMLMAQTALLTLSQSGERDMKRILSVLNRVLYKNIGRIREDKNMTLAILQYRNREFTVVGQHESVLICRKDGNVENLETMDLGLPIGLEENIESFVSIAHVKLEPGDTMVLYTDGVTEAENNGKQFEIGGLMESLKRNYRQPAQDILSNIVSDVYEFIGESKVYDDISMLVVKQR